MNRFLPFILMLANALLAFVAGWADNAFGLGVVYFVLLGVVALLLLARPRGFVATMGRGVAVAFIAILVILSLLTVAGMAVTEERHPMVAALTLGAITLAIQLLLLQVLTPKDANRRVIVGTTAVAGVVAFFALISIVFVVEIAGNFAGAIVLIPILRADSVLKTSVPRVQACAVRYAQSGSGYPPSLASIGPRPGDGCLDEQHASGRVGRIRVSYDPGPRDSAGRIVTYRVVARLAGWTRSYYQTLAFGDESGILRVSRSEDTLSRSKILHGGMEGVRAVRACAEYNRAQSSISGYPTTSRELFAKRPQNVVDETVYWLGCKGTDFPRFGGTTQANNSGTYTPIGDPARPSDYVLEIRPGVYGVRGVRSIRTTANGPVHVTVEDRAATEADPIVPTCAYDVSDGLCAPVPGGIAANVEVIAPDTLSLEQPVAVRIIDRRPASARDHPYQYHVVCTNANLLLPNAPPATYESSSDQQCRIRKDDPAEVREAWVRVWVRDYAGAATKVELRRPVRR